MELKTSLRFKIRFSEIDAMRVVWHGAYVKYLEDAREHFGKMFELSYDLIEREGYFAPIVDMSVQYKRPLTYNMEPEVTITYHPTEAAKIVFDYEIHDTVSNELIATARTIQVFMDHHYELIWDNPPFFEAWKRKWLNE